jgi:hypothetical protein
LRWQSPVQLGGVIGDRRALSCRRRAVPAARLEYDIAWEICIIKVDRDTKRGSANFVYSAEAELWRVTPELAERIAENARPRPADFI